ncbi:MAG TPA: hypothetical protein VHW01_25595 [Polyangiaceae bacterium]|jgi:hypothetical protein|nr:hypothetical protein [Polyangiaceae bacterium]
MRELEPLSFDRALQTAAGELERRKKTGESLADALPDQLVDEETLHWLRESRTKDPLASSLELWLLRLREQVELGPRRRELALMHRQQLYGISEPEQVRLPLSEMLNLALSRPRERAAYLRGYFASAGDLGDQLRRLWEERQIFADRLGTSLDSFEVASTELAPAAARFIADTRSAFETLQIKDPARLLSTALAEDAQEGWPARLSQRTTLELLGDGTWIHGLRLRSFATPIARGAGSFLLALSSAGRAISDAASALRSPFVLATDVFDLRRNSVGALLGMLPLSPTFATRRLGLSPSRVRDQQRHLARAALADTRVAAFRVLLRGLLSGGTKVLNSDLPELSDGALGFDLPTEVAGVFIRVRPRDSQRFAGTLLASSRHETLVQTHDDDWFRNPRAIAELRAELNEPMTNLPTTEELAAGSRALVARLQALL